MNRTHGIRIPAAFESDENWYRINRYGGKSLIGWSVPVIIIGIGLILAHFKFPISLSNIAIVTPFIFTPLILFGALLQTIHWAQRNVSSSTYQSP
jgi:hypothetical protein